MEESLRQRLLIKNFLEEINDEDLKKDPESFWLVVGEALERSKPQPKTKDALSKQVAQGYRRMRLNKGPFAIRGSNIIGGA
jgi:hypothetical protein